METALNTEEENPVRSTYSQWVIDSKDRRGDTSTTSDNSMTLQGTYL